MWLEDTVKDEPSSSSQQSASQRAETQSRVGSGSGSDGDCGEIREGCILQATQPYTPTAPGELAVLQDDTVKILKPGPQGWAKAFNTRTGDAGFVPVKHLKRFQVADTPWRNPLPPPDLVPHNGPDYVQYSPQVPPKSGSSTSSAIAEPQYVELIRPERDETGQGDTLLHQAQSHRLVDVFFLTPVLCKHCKFLHDTSFLKIMNILG